MAVVRKMKQAFVERAIQAQLVQSYLQKTPYPSIMTGDFNDVPGSYTYSTIKGDWEDAFLQKGLGIGATYLGISPTLRIDYILTNSHWKVRAWESVDENLSDHHMILADLQLIKN
jgi:endonuclease/exonuclease/phosphatase family metal-dependent hydrolase